MRGFTEGKRITEMILGIDFGLKRIGLAVSDNGILARPLMTIEYKGTSKTLDRLHNIFGSMHETPQYIVIGSGFEQAKSFGEAVENYFKVPVFFQDENHSSLEAEEYIRQTLNQHNPKKVKELLDAVAATVILQSYIEARKGGK